MVRVLLVVWILGALAAASPAAGRPAPAVPVPASADADTRALALAMESQSAAWAGFREALGPVQVKLNAFAAEYAAYRALADIADAPAREREAAGRFGWMPREAPGQLRAFDGGMKRLEGAGLAAAVKRATADLDRMTARAEVTANAMEFAQEEAPGLSGRDAARAWDGISGALAQAARILGAHASSLPSSPAIFLWTQTLPEAEAMFAGAVAVLDSTVREFPDAALCAGPDRWRDAQRAFSEARAPASGHAPCGDFFLTAAFPRLRAPVWDGGAHLFLYDPDERVGRFADRARASLVTRWYPRLKNPPALTPAWLALRSAALEPAAVERARALHARFQGWRGEAGPDPRILIGLGLVQSAREILRIDQETFTARYLLEAPFTAQVNELLRADERDGFASGRVTDALTGAPVIDARILFEADGRTAAAQTDTSGAFKVVFPRSAGGQFRVVVSREGFQTITHAGPPPSPVLVPYDFKLSRVPGQFVVSGVVTGQTSGKPVQNAVVIAAPARGASSRVYTGANGAFRLVLEVAEGVPIEIRAQKGDAASQVKITSRGAERTGIRLQLDAREGGAITQVWELDDEGATTSAEAELEEAPPGPRRAAPSARDGRGARGAPAGKSPDRGAEAPAGKSPDRAADAPAGKSPDRAADTPATPAQTGSPATSSQAGSPATPAPPERGAPASPGRGAPLAAARFLILDGPPTRQMGALGSICEDLGGTLEIVPVAGAFPDTIIPGRAYHLEARIEYRPPIGVAQSARVAVRACFLDATTQVETLVFDGAGTRAVAFDFTAPGVDPAYGATFAGVIAVGEVSCVQGEVGTRMAAALQHYSRR